MMSTCALAWEAVARAAAIGRARKGVAGMGLSWVDRLVSGYRRVVCVRREFDVMVGGVEKRLGPGDSFYIEPNVEHGAVCRKAGVLIDAFSPAREDFLEEADSD